MVIYEDFRIKLTFQKRNMKPSTRDAGHLAEVISITNKPVSAKLVVESEDTAAGEMVGTNTAPKPCSTV